MKGYDYLSMQDVQNFLPEAANFTQILTCRNLTEEARPGEIEMHGGYLRRSSERMVKRNREMKRKQKEMSEEEDIDPEESARICFLRAENKRLLKVKETEKMALQKQIDDHNEEKGNFVEMMAKQMRASCLEMERQLKEKTQK